MTRVSIKSENAEYGSEVKTGGMGRCKIGYIVWNAEVTEAEVEGVGSDGRLRGIDEVEDEDLRLFLGESDDEDERELRLDVLFFDLPSFDMMGKDMGCVVRGSCDGVR